MSSADGMQTVAEVLKEIRQRREVMASPNDGVPLASFYTGQIGTLTGIAVVDQGERVRLLENQLREEQIRRRKAEDELTQYKNLLKRADEMVDDLRLSGDPVTAPRSACQRSECAAVRTKLADADEERRELRKRLVRLQLGQSHRDPA